MSNKQNDIYVENLIYELEKILSDTRGMPGLSIIDIACIIKEQFDKEEVDSLVKELNK